MKVAISIPDPLFHDAERVSRQLRVPRSQLYAVAIQAYVRQHSGDEITARMNAAVAKVGAALDPGWENPGLEVLRRESS